MHTHAWYCMVLSPAIAAFLALPIYGIYPYVVLYIPVTNVKMSVKNQT